MSDSSVHNKRIEKNANGMADVAKSIHFHALEETGSLCLGQNFLINKWRVGLCELWSHFQLHDSMNVENSCMEKISA